MCCELTFREVGDIIEGEKFCINCFKCSFPIIVCIIVMMMMMVQNYFFLLLLPAITFPREIEEWGWNKFVMKWGWNHLYSIKHPFTIHDPMVIYQVSGWLLCWKMYFSLHDFKFLFKAMSEVDLQSRRDRENNISRLIDKHASSISLTHTKKVVKKIYCYVMRHGRAAKILWIQNLISNIFCLR